jgi:hypothetical protein
MHRPMYRILYSPTGTTWLDDPRNSRRDVGRAVTEAQEFIRRCPTGRVRVINARTRYVIWQHPQ